ncbi:MAG TPA: malto-oligosyltrehalose synthase [Tepidisphaeraceae bacterium]|nr:malto-oligosyltrehalose synthase [Tepidisphaeraceae bacterium]
MPLDPFAYPESTYRIQFHKGFSFRDATAIIPYLSELGITHVYASPYLKAKPGSTHGYDVIDHCSLNPELGTEADYAAFLDALKRHGMSHILDIVPNHVGIGTNDNKWWNDVLAHGPASPYANYFDITWQGSCRPDLQGKVLLPVLGKTYGQALEAGELKLIEKDGSYFVAYYQRHFPINPETLEKPASLDGFNGTPGDPASFDRLDELLNRQVYRLAYWRVAPDDINYRRFFDINDLAALSMERQEVFDETHKLIFQWIAEGKLAGLRIDHPDGLYDPKQYFERLQQRFREVRPDANRPLYVAVEKILAVGEPLPPAWPVNGTSGYDFLNEVNGLFVDRGNESAISQTYERLTGQRTSFEDLVYEKKKLILDRSLASELHMLARRLDRLAQSDRSSRDFTETGLRNALAEVIACFPVYRSYLNSSSPNGECHVRHAIVQSIRRNPTTDPAVFHFISDMLLQKSPRGFTKTDRADQLRFAGKFQQLTAPVTAKGIEDTAFYVYNRLISLNEVGGDPGRFGILPDELHSYFKDRQTRWPYALSPLSTHDTKRSEDVRARINVLSEMPEEWERAVTRWMRLNDRHRKQVNGSDAPDRNDEYLLYQTLIGGWPMGEYDAAAWTSRITSYLQKALREAKVHTSWTDPNEQYEQATLDFARQILDPAAGAEFLAEFLPFQKRISELGIFNSLSQALLRIAAPGVPDTYQGSELWDFSLVDPDNRRPVNYESRRTLLAERNSPREMLLNPQDGRIKLFVTTTALRARRERPGLFSKGEYLPASVSGSESDHVFAFARRHGPELAIVLVPRLVAKLQVPVGAGVWGDTAISIPGLSTDADLVNCFTGARIRWDGTSMKVAEALGEFPVALLATSSSR